MTDLTTLDDEAFIDSFQEHFAEGHRRLRPTNHGKSKAWFNVSHNAAERALKHLSDAGAVAAREGDDKDRGDDSP